MLVKPYCYVGQEHKKVDIKSLIKMSFSYVQQN